MAIKNYAIGTGIGVALCVAATIIQAVGPWPVLCTLMVSWLVLYILSRPFKSLCYTFTGLIRMHRLVQCRYVPLYLGLFIIASYFHLYHQSSAPWLGSSPFREWLMLGVHDLEAMKHEAKEELSALWSDGVDLAHAVGPTGPIGKFARWLIASYPAWFWSSLGVAGLLWHAGRWARSFYTDSQLPLAAQGVVEEPDSASSYPYPSLCQWAIARLRIWLANVDVLEAPYGPPHAPTPDEIWLREIYGMCCGDITVGCLDPATLPRRAGPRPVVSAVTQRQLDQPAPPGTAARLEALAEQIAAPRRDLLFAPQPDGTAHVVLHADDVWTVLQAGWGQRHPLATRWVWWRRLLRGVPEGTVLLYAPRNETEVDVVGKIVIAAVDHDTNLAKARLSSPHCAHN